MKRALFGVLHAVESTVMALLGVGCIVAILAAVMLVTLWLLLR
jgi:hypothetical protein